MYVPLQIQNYQYVALIYLLQYNKSRRFCMYCKFLLYFPNQSLFDKIFTEIAGITGNSRSLPEIGVLSKKSQKVSFEKKCEIEPESVEIFGQLSFRSIIEFQIIITNSNLSFMLSHWGDLLASPLLDATQAPPRRRAARQPR